MMVFPGGKEDAATDTQYAQKFGQCHGLVPTALR